MKSLSPYLVFNGNCREAMTFYQQCLGGELLFQTLGDVSASAQMTERMRKCVLNATLVSEGIHITGSDIVGDMGLIRGNAVALMLRCNTEQELNMLVNKLSEGSEIYTPDHSGGEDLQFFDFSDKFGTNWILHCSQKQ